MLATASFDLLDTLLVRPVADPHEIFRLVERDLAAPGWAVARAEAERAARTLKPSREVDLDEIYAAPPLNRWRADLPRFRAKELEWESTMRLDPVAVARVLAARAEGARILYITDMYLPREFFLARLAPVWAAGDTLLISHEAGDSKGRTWWKSLADAHPRPWLHLGDNPHGDVAMPRRHGIRAELWTRSRPNPLEKHLARDNPDAPLVPGISRLARLSRPADAPDIWDDGANVSGPFCHGFVRWILHDARERGIERVLFLSRDGQLPEKVARRLRAADPTLPESVYLCGSRHAWYLALFDPALPAHRQWVNHIPRPTIAGMFENLDLDPLDLEPVLLRLGHPRDTWDSPLTIPARHGVWDRLARDSEAAAYFARHRARRLALALAYLRAQGVFDSPRLALVDIGWSGTMHQAFVQLLTHAPGPHPHVRGYFFGLHQNLTADRDCFHLRPGRWPHWLSAFPSVIEMLVPGDHGQTLGYQAADGAATPVFAPDQVAPPEVITALHDGALAYVDAALRLAVPPPRLNRVLHAFLVHPDPARIARWSAFRFWTWQKPSDTSPPSLIPVFSKSLLLRRILSPWRKIDVWPWPTATLRATLPGTPAVLLDLLVLKFQADRFAWYLLHVVATRLRALKRRLRPLPSGS